MASPRYSGLVHTSMIALSLGNGTVLTLKLELPEEELDHVMKIKLVEDLSE